MKNFTTTRVWISLFLLLALLTAGQTQQMAPSDFILGNWVAPGGVSVSFEYHDGASVRMVLGNGQSAVVGTTFTDGGKVMIDLSSVAAGAVGLYDQSSETIAIYEQNQFVEKWVRQ